MKKSPKVPQPTPETVIRHELASCVGAGPRRYLAVLTNLYTGTVSYEVHDGVIPHHFTTSFEAIDYWNGMGD
jgi:hypothetical protein